MAFSGHRTLHLAQLMQTFVLTRTSVPALWDSGFAHHLQRREQPFKNITVRIPRPSSVANRSILNTCLLYTSDKAPCSACKQFRRHMAVSDARTHTLIALIVFFIFDCKASSSSCICTRIRGSSAEKALSLIHI